YGREACTLIHPAENEELVEEMILQQVFDLAEQKLKTQWKQRLRGERGFTIGDKVLIYKAAQENSWSNKLDPKWI
ncbi:15138_t:CDS:2, partial [Acaulospora morrowiae]